MNRALWFREEGPGGIGTAIQIEGLLEERESPYQKIEIYQTTHFGRMMVLDGCIMFTEGDEFIYHEMLVHPAGCCLPELERALIIGGGDGGTARELLRYPAIKKVDLVEIDRDVVELSKKYFPSLSKSFSDPRLSVHFEDGSKYVENYSGENYDLVVIDSTDPVGAAENLLSEDFYDKCRGVLSERGILAVQSESPFLYREVIESNAKVLSKLFKEVALYSAPVISYPTGWWCFFWASNRNHPKNSLNRKLADSLARDLKYYNSEIHLASFALPNLLKKTLPPVLAQ